MIKKVLFLSLLIISCKGSTVVMDNDNPENNQLPKPSKNDVIYTDVKKKQALVTTPEEVKEIVSYLASDKLKGRDTGSEGIDKAAIYIANDFKASGVKEYYSSYRDTFKVGNKEAFNVVGVIEGEDPELKNEFVVIGAHYDHIGNGSKVGEDIIANGANDNAAGTAVVMELAKYLVNKKNKRSVLFVAFAAEEKGLLGSKHLAKRLKKEGVQVRIVLNFEMIGVPLKDKDYTAYVTGYEMSNLAEKMNSYASANLVGYLPKAKQYQLFSRSDNYPFYEEFNIPAQTFCTFDFTNFDYYHHVDDEIDKLDFNHMASFINAYAPAVEKVINSKSGEIKLNE